MTVARKRDGAVDGPVEILADRLRQTGLNIGAQRGADIDLLACDGELHCARVLKVTRYYRVHRSLANPAWSRERRRTCSRAHPALSTTGTQGAADALRKVHALLQATPFDGRGNAHGFAVFRDRATRDVDPGFAQDFHNAVVDKMAAGNLVVDQIPDVVTHGLGRMGFAALGGRLNGDVKKYLSSNVPRGVAMYLLAVTRLTVDSCMLIASAIDAQIQRPQMRHAVREEAVLLTHDFGCDLQDRARALIEAAHEPIRVVEAIDEIRLRVLGLRRRRVIASGLPGASSSEFLERAASDPSPRARSGCGGHRPCGGSACWPER